MNCKEDEDELDVVGFVTSVLDREEDCLRTDADVLGLVRSGGSLGGFSLLWSKFVHVPGICLGVPARCILVDLSYGSICSKIMVLSLDPAGVEAEGEG